MFGADHLKAAMDHAEKAVKRTRDIGIYEEGDEIEDSDDEIVEILETLPPKKRMKSGKVLPMSDAPLVDIGAGASITPKTDTLPINKKIMATLPSILRSNVNKSDIDDFKADNNLKVTFYAILLSYRRMDIKTAGYQGHMMTLQILHDEPVAARYVTSKKDTQLYEKIKTSTDKDMVKKAYRPPIMVEPGAIIHVVSFDVKTSAVPMVFGTVLRILDFGYKVDYEFRHPSDIEPALPFSERVNKGDPYIKYECEAAVDTSKSIFSIIKDMKVPQDIADFRRKIISKQEFVSFPESSRLKGVYDYFASLPLKKIEKTFKDRTYEEYEYDESPDETSIYKTFPTAYDHYAISNELLLKRTSDVHGLWFRLFNSLPYYEDDMSRVSPWVEDKDFLCFVPPFPDPDEVSENDRQRWLFKKSITEGGVQLEIRTPCIRDDSGCLPGIVVKQVNADLYPDTLFTVVSGTLWDAHDVYAMCSKMLWKHCGYLLFMATVGYAYFEPSKESIRTIADEGELPPEAKTVGRIEYVINPYQTFSYAGLKVSHSFAMKFLDDVDALKMNIFCPGETLTSVHGRNHRSGLYKSSGGVNKPAFVNMREYEFGKHCRFNESDWVFFMIPCKSVVMSHDFDPDKIDNAATVLKATNFIAMNDDALHSDEERESVIKSKWFNSKPNTAYTALYAVRRDLSLI